MALEISPNTFTPRQAEQITGVSVDQQRDYRRHGYLPKTEGHARFDAYDLAKLAFVKAMADRGIGPRHSFAVADDCARGIVYHALKNADAYEGNLSDLIVAGVVEPVTDEFVARMNAMIAAEPDVPKLTAENLNARAQAQFLQQYISSLHWDKPIPADYFISWADGSESWHNNLQGAVDSVAYQDARRNGPMTLISFESMGFQLVVKCQLPLFSISVKIGG